MSINQFTFLRRKSTLIWAFVLCAVLTACVQDIRVYIPRYADKAAISVSEDTLKTVNRTFYASFIAGDWYYKGAKAGHNGINAYIQIPQKLDLAVDIQEKYLREAICPKAENIALWNQLKQVNLSVHIYTTTKSKSVSATCENPWQTGKAPQLVASNQA